MKISSVWGKSSLVQWGLLIEVASLQTYGLAANFTKIMSYIKATCYSSDFLMFYITFLFWIVSFLIHYYFNIISSFINSPILFLFQNCLLSSFTSVYVFLIAFLISYIKILVYLLFFWFCQLNLVRFVCKHNFGYSFLFLKFYVFIYLCLCWVFVAAFRLSLVEVSGNYFLVIVCGFFIAVASCCRAWT